MKKNNRLTGIVNSCVAAAAILICGCADHWDDYTPNHDKDQTNAINFAGSVVSGRIATRADGSLVNLNEFHLPQSTEHSYWRYDPTDKQVKENAVTYYAGIFGAYTGQYTWAELVRLKATDYADRATKLAGITRFTELIAETSEEAFNAQKKEILDTYYSATLLFNQKADIAAPAGNVNALSYSPLRFWPNTPLTSDPTQHEYATFWAYYPYNPTGSVGAYGIAINETNMGTGMGMGRVTFTMHPDASQQNDFMISAPVVDCNRDQYPLMETAVGSYTPKPVQFKLYHMLAQVRLYAYIIGKDKMVYQDANGDGEDDVADATWFESWAVDATIKDEWGNVYTKKGTNAVERTTQKAAFPTEFAADLTKDEFVALGLKVPDESKCVRWSRLSTTDTWDVNHTRRRADIHYKMEFNNIKTTADFYPDYLGGTATIGHTPGTTLGSATVNHYIMNPYWFRFDESTHQRYMLNDHYMYHFFEDTPAYKATSTYESGTPTMSGNLSTLKEDGIDWSLRSSNSMGYDISDLDGHSGKEIKNSDNNKHYNYAPGNILMVVPQTLEDEDVPHIVITATDNSTGQTAKVTVNMLNMNISWESGYIYCYAFLDELMPGDDKVRGPESITVAFDSTQDTDQW